MIYHEHYNYWSLTSLINFFKPFNVNIFRAQKIDTHGGSIRIFLKKGKNTLAEKNVNDLLKEEEKFGIKNFQTYKNFGEKVYKIRENVLKNINKIKEKNKNIIGYGAPAKATTALNFYGISDQIELIVEDNKLKHNKFIPGVQIPISSKINIKGKKLSVIVLAWNFFEDIKKNNSSPGLNFINIKDLEKENFKMD